MCLFLALLLLQHKFINFIAQIYKIYKINMLIYHIFKPEMTVLQ